MLLVGTDDGVYRASGRVEDGPTETEQILQSGRVLRLRTFDGIPGVFAATKTGLYHSPDGENWTTLDVPQDEVYAVVARPDDGRIYAGTRPAHVYVAELDGSENVPASPEWRDLDAFRALSERDDWGIERHDDIAQVRSLQIPDDEPDRLIAGVEVGGVYVSDDAGETWQDRRITGFDAPHTDDIHHLSLADSETIHAATGSGLYRTEDAGRTWTRLDAGHPQNYFRESWVHDGTLFAGGSPTSPRYWTENRNHVLFEYRDGGALEAAETPVPDEVAVGWVKIEGKLYTATNLGTLLERDGERWTQIGAIPVAESVHGRCIPLAWIED